MAKATSKKAAKKSPHKTLKRSYREDYVRESDAPGVMYHIFATFKILFKNWKLFLPFLILVVVLNILFVGITNSEYTQQIVSSDLGTMPKAGLLFITTLTTSGLSGGSSEAATVFGVTIFLIIWLVTIYLLRQIFAGHKVKLRDGLYNAMTPLISTFVVFVVALIQCIPIFLLIIAYSAAVKTEFLTTPFYALLFFVFAALMIIISGYLLSSSLIAFVAVTAPGLYPLPALRTASELMMGRRMKFIIRLIALIFLIIILWVVIMLPLILFDLWMKSYEWAANIPFIQICFIIMSSITCIYSSAYLYLYYRWMLGYDKK